MNLHHLQYFYSVASLGGYTKAARALRIQQPAISRMVKLLEQDVGFALFEKVGRNVRLTAQGMGVFEHCRRIFGEIDQLKASLPGIRQELKGTLKIAAAEVAASHLLPKALGSLQSLAPDLLSSVFSGPASFFLGPILDGELDFGVFFHLPHVPDGLKIVSRHPLRYHLVVRSDLKTDTQVIQRFIGSREVDDVSTRRFPTLEKLRVKHPKARIAFSSNSLTGHKTMVLEGMGCAVLPAFLVGPELKQRLLYDLLPSEKLFFDLKIVKVKNRPLSPAGQAFLRQLAQVLPA